MWPYYVLSFGALLAVYAVLKTSISRWHKAGGVVLLLLYQFVIWESAVSFGPWRGVGYRHAVESYFELERGEGCTPIWVPITPENLVVKGQV
jgi:hypothetical protein